MWNISKTDNRRPKRTKIWDSGFYYAYMEGTFDARFLLFGLGSFGALCKISNFTIVFKTLLLSQVSSNSSKLYTMYHNHTGSHFSGDRPKIAKKKIWHFEIFLKQDHMLL